VAETYARQNAEKQGGATPGALPAPAALPFLREVKNHAQQQPE